MKRKQLWKVLGTGCLAASLLVSPMTGLSALAAGEDSGTGSETGDGGTQDDQAGTGTGATNKKEGGSLKGLNPLQEAKPAVGDKPAVDAYADTEIPVWGFTQDSTVYSVDVEWGAMTFQYENSTWDPVNHVSIDGKGWQVYDSEADKVVVNDDGTKVTEHAINEIKVTNHSNAGVWATLTYAGEADHSDTTGDFSFTKGTGTAETGGADTDVLTPKSGTVPAYLTLTTAANNLGDGEGVGKETVGKAYFMPDGIGTDDETNGISKWTKIGTITVGIKTEQPGTTTPGTSDTEPTGP